MADFVLHERLASDTAALGAFALSRVLLMNERRWPWVLLVPQRAELRELHQLAETDAAELMREIRRVSASLEDMAQPAKINVGMLGNLVPQLHIHVLARFTDDPAWPGPVWGHSPREPYAPEVLEQQVQRFRTSLAI